MLLCAISISSPSFWSSLFLWLFLRFDSLINARTNLLCPFVSTWTLVWASWSPLNLGSDFWCGVGLTDGAVLADLWTGSMTVSLLLDLVGCCGSALCWMHSELSVLLIRMTGMLSDHADVSESSRSLLLELEDGDLCLCSDRRLWFWWWWW